MASKRQNAFRTNIGLFAILPAFLLSVGCWSTSVAPTDTNGEDDTTLGTGGIEETSLLNGAIVVTATEFTGSACPAYNFTQPCSCLVDGNRVAGRQTCDRSRGWSDCECVMIVEGATSTSDRAGDPTANKVQAQFSWKKTLPASNGNCKAGRYSGVFSGFYNSPSMGAFDVSFSPVGIPVIGTVEFDLKQVDNGEYFEIKDGSMEGFALVVFPFRADLVGTFNCEDEQPLKDIGLKNGVYNIVGTNYYFEGRAVSLYNKQNATFSSGEWAVTEPTDYTSVVRNEDGTADLTNAVFAPLPQLVPGTPPVIDIFVEGGTGAWDAFWIGPTTDVDVSTTPTHDAEMR